MGKMFDTKMSLAEWYVKQAEWEERFNKRPHDIIECSGCGQLYIHERAAEHYASVEHKEIEKKEKKRIENDTELNDERADDDPLDYGLPYPKPTMAKSKYLK